MTDDRTLLERAAKAAGLTIIGWNTQHGVTVAVLEDQTFWQPLLENSITDCMGDAFRLSVKLSMRVEVWPEPINDMRGVVLFRDSEVAIQSESDPYAATRRAIVRAAASMEAKE